MKYYIRKLAWIVFIALIGLAIANPHSHAVSDFVGEAMPLTILFGIFLGSSKKPPRRVSGSERAIAETERLKAERDKAYQAGRQEEWNQQLLTEKKRLALEQGASRLAAVTEFDWRMADISMRVQAGMLTQEQAKEAWAQASGLLDQMQGRPQWTVSTSARLPHSCNGKFYARVEFCPVHGKKSPAQQVAEIGEDHGLPVVTELKKAGLPVIVYPPFNCAPPVSAGGPDPLGYLSGVPSGHTYDAMYTPVMTGREPTDEELQVIRVRLADSLGKQLMVRPERTTVEEAPDGEPEPVDDYTPAGQDEMLGELARVIRAQVREHGVAGHYPSLRWFMSPDWLAEVRKLKDKNDRLLCVPRPGQSMERLYGYPVTVGESFGVPELREP